LSRRSETKADGLPFCLV